LLHIFNPEESLIQPLPPLLYRHGYPTFNLFISFQFLRLFLMPLKLPTLSSEVLEPALSHTGLTGQDICARFRDTDWRSLDSRNRQVAFLYNFARCNCLLGLSNQVLGRIFQIAPQYVVKILCKSRNSSRPPHRPFTLEEDQEISVLDFIRHGFSAGNYVAQREVLSFIAESFGKTVTHGWLSSFLDCWSDHITRTVVSPQEQLRLQIPHSFLDDYIRLIQIYVLLVPTKLIFNLDETGLPDWEERKSKLVIVPSDAIQIPLHYPVDRGIRYHTLLCCRSASGDAYTPLLIAPRPSANRILEKASTPESI
jgi:hypothetical protein